MSLGHSPQAAALAAAPGPWPCNPAGRNPPVMRPRPLQLSLRRFHVSEGVVPLATEEPCPEWARRGLQRPLLGGEGFDRERTFSLAQSKVSGAGGTGPVEVGEGRVSRERRQPTRLRRHRGERQAWRR